MSFTLKDIKGAVIPRKDYLSEDDHVDIRDCDFYNAAVAAQSFVKLRLNKERLVSLLEEDLGFKMINGLNCNSIADAIIAAEREIIEVENDYKPDKEKDESMA